jgi:hypothetical protein
MFIRRVNKHVNKFCGMPVYPENGNHALIYLVAGVIIKSRGFNSTDSTKILETSVQIQSERWGDRSNLLITG